MQDIAEVTGMVLKSQPIGEYDRRVVILTTDRGKISAFARGARRPNSRLLAATNPFCFGKFKLYPGRDSYTLVEASISNFFEELRTDFAGAYYGIYFLEIADYYTRENNDDTELLKVLYQSLKALIHPGYDNKLVRYIFEIKAMVTEGEFPGLPQDQKFSDSTSYTVDYIVNASAQKLFNFTVSDVVLEELGIIALACRKYCIDRDFKSLEIVDNL